MEVSAATLCLPSVPRTAPSSHHFAASRSVFFSNGRTDLLRKNRCSVSSRNDGRGRSGFNCRCIFGLGVPELVVIAGVAALVFGPKKLPEVGRSIGKTVKSFQQAAKEFESELKKGPDPAIEPPEEKPVASSEEKKQEAKVPSTEENL